MTGDEGNNVIIELADRIKSQGIVVLDIEGSGGAIKNDPYNTGSMVSLGAVDFKTKDEFYEECKVMPGRGYDHQALKVNGFSREQIFDESKQSVLDLLVKFGNFCKVHDAKLLGAWGDYDKKMLISAYAYYQREWNLPSYYINLKLISKMLLGKNKPGLSNTAIKLGMIPEQEPHIAINGARLAVENISVLLFKRHYYDSYKKFDIQARQKSRSVD